MRYQNNFPLFGYFLAYIIIVRYVFSTSWKKERDVTNVIVLFMPEDMSEELGRVSVRKKQNGRSGGSTGRKSHKFPVVRRILFNNYDSSC